MVGEKEDLLEAIAQKAVSRGQNNALHRNR